MTSDVAVPDAEREATRQVGAELRRLGELLAAREPSAEVLTEVAAELRGAAARLAGEPERPRWYESGASGLRDAAASRAYHDELGPLRGEANPVAPPLRFESATRPDGAAAVAAVARLGLLHEGPPGLVHGGWIAAMFDEVLAVLQRDAGVGGVTAELTVRYRRPTPVGAELRFAGWIDDDRGRSVVARATCEAAGELVAEAEARFVRV
jgi:acyl-coenzyme A thioesterase PaaI-like protein